MKKKIVLFSVIGLLVVGGGGASAYFFMFSDDPVEGALTADGVPIEEEKPEKLPPALYHNLPGLVVSAQYEGRLRYLQVKLTMMTRDEDTLEELESNTPLIQDSLIMLLGTYEFSYLETIEGKERLRVAAQEKINELIDSKGLESVLFTGFVIQ